MSSNLASRQPLSKKTAKACARSLSAAVACFKNIVMLFKLRDEGIARL